MRPGGGEHPLTVAVRVRPMSEEEIMAGGTQIAHMVDKQMVVLLDPTEDPDDILRANRSREKRYVFDHAFDNTCNQEEVYQATTHHLIEQVISGYNGTVFAYGATGAGKTHTMLGTPNEPGIYHRALNDLFMSVAQKQEENIYQVSMSYLEIYNEMVRDLLNISSGYLEMREDAKGGVQVAGLFEISTTSTEEIMELLHRGNMERTQEPTKANKTSSRSHAVLQVTVKQRQRARGVNSQVKIGRLFLVDLAGSERAANTQNRGKRMVEGAHINRSLLALGNCITALSEYADKGARYVNYRDSKLTRLLKDALGGNCKTVMIAHVGPASLHFEESRNTLLYADRAKRIKNKVRRNVEDVSYHIAQYTAIIAELRGEIERLRTKVSQSMTQTPSIQAVQNEVLRSANDHEFMKLKEQLLMTFKDQMELRRSLMDLNNTSVEINQEASRHTLAISEWEAENAKMKERKERGSDNRDKDLDKLLDLEGASYDDEPEDVNIARDELKVLMVEKKRTEKLRSNVTKELDIARQKASMLEENLPKYVSTDTQKEVLTLLLRIHELEIENVELQSQCYMKENELRSRDLLISRYQNYKSLAEEIISQQRELLGEQNITTPKELEELYNLYQQEQALLEEGLGSTRHFLPVLKGSSQVNLVELGMEDSAQNLDKLSTLAEETGTRYNSTVSRYRQNASDEDDKVFSHTPKSFQVHSRENSGVPRHLSVSPLKVKQKEDTLYTISMRSNSVESLDKKESPPQPVPRDLVAIPKVNKETRGIAALAAAKRRRQQQQDITRVGGGAADPIGRTFVSNFNLDDEAQLTPSRLETHNMKFNGSRAYLQAAENDNESLVTMDQRSLHTDATMSMHKKSDSSPGRFRIPRSKYRPHPLGTRSNNAHPSVTSTQDHLSDRASDSTTSKYVKHNSQQQKRSQGQTARQPPAYQAPRPTRKTGDKLKPPTNKITSRYLKSLGAPTLSEPRRNKNPPPLGKESKPPGATGRTGSKKSLQPSIPSYRKGDITVSGFSLRY